MKMLRNPVPEQNVRKVKLSGYKKGRKRSLFPGDLDPAVHWAAPRDPNVEKFKPTRLLTATPKDFISGQAPP